MSKISILVTTLLALAHTVAAINTRGASVSFKPDPNDPTKIILSYWFVWLHQGGNTGDSCTLSDITSQTIQSSSNLHSFRLLSGTTFSNLESIFKYKCVSIDQTTSIASNRWSIGYQEKTYSLANSPFAGKTDFKVGFSACCFAKTLQKMEILTKVTLPSAGTVVNSSPRVKPRPPLFATTACLPRSFLIGVVDPDGDSFTCRASVAGQRECGDICTDLTSVATLTSEAEGCRIQVNAGTAAGTYYLAMQIEDKAGDGSVKSSVAFQITLIIEAAATCFVSAVEHSSDCVSATATTTKFYTQMTSTQFSNNQYSWLPSGSSPVIFGSTTLSTDPLPTVETIVTGGNNGNTGKNWYEVHATFQFPAAFTGIKYVCMSSMVQGNEYTDDTCVTVTYSAPAGSALELNAAASAVQAGGYLQQDIDILSFVFNKNIAVNTGTSATIKLKNNGDMSEEVITLADTGKYNINGNTVVIDYTTVFSGRDAYTLTIEQGFFKEADVPCSTIISPEVVVTFNTGYCGNRDDIVCSGVCFPSTAICDGSNECSTRQDEAFCDAACPGLKCPSTNECITREQICDGVKQCQNGEDELFCGGTSCGDGQIICNKADNSGLECKDASVICDGAVDCSDFYDEGFCPVTTGCDAISCIEDIQCLPRASICDGTLDCSKGSDEWFCTSSSICDSNPCIHGTCTEIEGEDIDVTYTYTCVCDPGYQHPIVDGTPNLLLCQENCNISDCSDTPDNFACLGVARRNFYTCQCDTGFSHPTSPGVTDITRDTNVCDVSCSNSQCGQTTMVDNGICDGTQSTYTCTCNTGFDHPRSIANVDDLTSCGPICTVEQCKVNPATDSAASCDGTTTDYTCTCNVDFVHPFSAVTGDDVTKCDTPCEDTQCGVDGAGKCKGTTSAYVCDCNLGFENPPGIGGNVDVTQCKQLCNVDDCRENDGVNLGDTTCNGYTDGYTCTCGSGLSHPYNGVPDEQKCGDACTDNQCGITGAGMCIGTMTTYLCKCNTGFDLRSNVCEKLCSNDQCDETPGIATGSTCGGFEDSHTCTCADNYDHPYEDGAANIKKCGANCSDSDCDVAIGDVATSGATCVSGTPTSPQCQCASTQVSTDDGVKCAEKCSDSDCRANDAEATCNGFKGDYTCTCSSRFRNPIVGGVTNKRACEELCDVNNCKENFGSDIGSITCDGSITDYMCTCDASTTHPFSSDGTEDLTKCGEKCQNIQCGDSGNAGTCKGTYSSYVCECNPTYGYQTSGGVEIKTRCHKLCDTEHCKEDPSVDVTLITCDGFIDSYTCNCNSDTLAHPIDNSLLCGEKCLDSDCGVAGAGTCMGTRASFECTCNTGFTKIGSTCEESCTDSDCNEENNGVPTTGATCLGGTASNPQCQCASNQIPTLDGIKCAEKCSDSDCRANDPKATCNGFKGDYTCTCSSGFRNPIVDGVTNKRACEELCNVDNCKETPETDLGATTCDGSIDKYMCTCPLGVLSHPYSANGVADLTKCGDNCTNTQCGPTGFEGDCRGTLTSYYCVCVTPYIHPEINGVPDRTKCEPPCENSQCGVDGAGKCIGTTTLFSCECNPEYAPRPAGSTINCEKLCSNDQCDEDPAVATGSTCDGFEDSHTCTCAANHDHPYESGVPNTQKCGAKCSNSDCDETIGDVATSGATCLGGTVSNPQCQCASNQISAPDGVKCAEKCSDSDCTANDPDATCNDFKGDYTCTCSEGFRNPIVGGVPNMLACEELCNVDNCKETPETVLGATTCDGSIIDYTCMCDVNSLNHPYSVNGVADNKKCGVPCTDDQCGDGGSAGSCIGTTLAYNCECNTGYVHPKKADGSQDLTQCRKLCDVENCKETIGTVLGSTTCQDFIDDYSCMCDDSLTHPYSSNVGPDNTKCGAKCSNTDCDATIGGVATSGATCLGGTVSNPQCQCATTQISAPDGIKCAERCDDNDCNSVDTLATCVGYKGDYECKCSTDFDHPRDSNGVEDLLACEELCSNDVVKYCGDLSDSCSGFSSNPTCTCKSGAFLSPVTNKCEPDPCADVNCGVHGKCEKLEYGQTYKGICRCEIYYSNLCYSQDVECWTDPCVPAPCTDDVIESCNEGATGCSGTMLDPICHCKKNGYELAESGKCEPLTCETRFAEICGSGATACTGMVPDHVCTCGDDYILSSDRKFCFRYIPTQDCDIEECGAFGSTESCMNINNGFACKCNSGHGHPTDILGFEILDRCEALCDLAECGDTATSCIGTVSKYTCICDENSEHATNNAGEPILTKCFPKCINEQCGENKAGVCDGTRKTYKCTCNEGFDHPLDQYDFPVLTRCVDKNECTSGDNDCASRKAVCNNTPGSFECICEEGYYMGASNNCMKDGGWSDWIDDSVCSSSCGGGTKRQVRNCDNPTPDGGGIECNGDAEQTIDCNQFPCFPAECFKEKPCNCDDESILDIHHPDSSLSYFKDISNEDVDVVFELVHKWTTYKNVCKEIDLSSLSNPLVLDSTRADGLASKYKDLMMTLRKMINCNTNSLIRTELFEAYKALTSKKTIIVYMNTELASILRSFKAHCDLPENWFHMFKDFPTKYVPNK